jgi:hypothetical protein
MLLGLWDGSLLICSKDLQLLEIPLDSYVLRFSLLAGDGLLEEAFEYIPKLDLHL